MRVKHSLMEVTVQTSTSLTKILRFWCCESNKVDLKTHEKELQLFRGIWVTIP